MKLCRDMLNYAADFFDLESFLAFTETCHWANRNTIFKRRLLKHGFTPANNAKKHINVELRRLFSVLKRLTGNPTYAKNLAIACYNDELEKHADTIRHFPAIRNILLDASALLGCPRSLQHMIDIHKVKPTLHQTYLAAKHGHRVILELLNDLYKVKNNHRTLMWAIIRQQKATIKYLVYEKFIPLYHPKNPHTPVAGLRWNYRHRFMPHEPNDASEHALLNDVMITELKELKDERLKEELLETFKENVHHDPNIGNVEKRFPRLSQELKQIDINRQRRTSY